MANVSKLLHTTVSDETFLLNLEANDALLKAAKTKIREHLRATFAASSEAYFGEAVAPKFFTQGSCAYKTLNDPAWPPTQQKDLDDGCYLPLGFIRGGKPSKAAETFFQFVDTALMELAKDEGWTFKRKPTCARLVITADAHIDVPLYAIPDHEFALMQKSIAANRMLAKDSKGRPDTWEALPSNAVLLAHRDEDWI
ncbi:MAG: CBASS cGAMP synthase, partial [Fimbriimonadaceae bacterium]